MTSGCVVGGGGGAVQLMLVGIMWATGGIAAAAGAQSCIRTIGIK